MMTVVLSGSASQVCQVDQDSRRQVLRQAIHQRADLRVIDQPRQSITAQQKAIAFFDRKGTFDINLDIGIGAQRPGDHVFGNRVAQGTIGMNLPAGFHFPNERMIERQLFERTIAKPIDAGIANVSHHRTGRQQIANELAVVPMLWNSGFCWPRR